MELPEQLDDRRVRIALIIGLLIGVGLIGGLLFGGEEAEPEPISYDYVVQPDAVTVLTPDGEELDGNIDIIIEAEAFENDKATQLEYTDGETMYTVMEYSDIRGSSLASVSMSPENHTPPGEVVLRTEGAEQYGYADGETTLTMTPERADIISEADHDTHSTQYSFTEGITIQLEEAE